MGGPCQQWNTSCGPAQRWNLFWVWDLEFTGDDVGFKVWVWYLGFRVQGLGFEVCGLGCKGVRV